ncbi:MAG: HlyD family secretion protein [Candidatus Symbiothrix sp.]|nr:HlyD family secretion protein [Candidatus Symbiothrix sp.]
MSESNNIEINESNNENMNEEDKIALRSEEFQEILGGVPPWILRWGITVLAVIVLILIIGSAFFKYPDIISSSVVLTGSTPPAAIVAHSSGKLNELYVADNQEVTAGEYLAVIDNPARTQDVLTLKHYLQSSVLSHCLDSRLRGNDTLPSLPPLPDKDLKLGNLQSSYSSFYTTLFEYREYKRLLYYPQKLMMTRERIVQYEQQYQNLLRQQHITEEQHLLVQNQFRRDSTLHAQEMISHEELEKSKNASLQSALSCETMRSTLNTMQIQLAQLKESLLDTGHQDIEKLNGLQTQLQSLVSQLKTAIQEWEQSYVLITPITGTITFTNFWTTNQNVSAGEDVFTVIPDQRRTVIPAQAGTPTMGEDTKIELIGKASLPIARSGKVKPGQTVNIRIENFPENEYGILRGTVQHISLVPVKSGEQVYYAVEITLPEGLMTTYKKDLPYLPNMQGQADIITEDISLLERLFLPIKKILKENL